MSSEVVDLARPPATFRYFDLIMAGFVTVLLCANLIGPAKVCQIDLPFALPLLGATLIFGAGNIFFPISYIFGDVLTEVYGYARARKVIWAGFAAMIFATLMTQTILSLPPSSSRRSARSSSRRPRMRVAGWIHFDAGPVVK